MFIRIVLQWFTSLSLSYIYIYIYREPKRKQKWENSKNFNQPFGLILLKNGTNVIRANEYPHVSATENTFFLYPKLKGESLPKI